MYSNKLKLLIPYIKYRLFLLGLKKQNLKQKDVVLFFMHPEYNIRSGGILSIYFLIDETKKYLKETIVLPVTLYKIPKYTKANWFENDFDIYNIYYLEKELMEAKNVLIHIPECFYTYFCTFINHYKLYELAKKMKVNILNQNDLIMPTEAEVWNSKNLFHSLTMTLAFEANVSKEYSYLDSKPYFISTWFYNYTIDTIAYERKENKCIVSLDSHPFKTEIINLLEQECGLECIEIKNMHFFDFQKLQQKAKWSITFGEGFDNYFAGAFIKSGIGFSVYNSTFFPPSFDKEYLPETVFDSYELMRDNIVKVLKRLDNKLDYENYVAKVKPIVLEHSSPGKVIEALNHYYNNELN